MMSRQARWYRNQQRRERRASQNGAPGEEVEDIIGAARVPIGRGVAPENVNDAHAAQEAARARERAQREPYAVKIFALNSP